MSVPSLMYVLPVKVLLLVSDRVPLPALVRTEAPAPLAMTEPIVSVPAPYVCTIKSEFVAVLLLSVPLMME